MNPLDHKLVLVGIECFFNKLALAFFEFVLEKSCPQPENRFQGNQTSVISLSRFILFLIICMWNFF